MSKSIKIDRKEFAKRWCESVENGEGLEYVQRYFHATKQQLSGFGSQLRKELAKMGVDFPEQRKPGAPKSVTQEQLIDIADLVKGFTVKPEPQGNTEAEGETETEGSKDFNYDTLAKS